MSYSVETTNRFDREFKKLDKYTQRMIKSWIDKNLVGCENLCNDFKEIVTSKHSKNAYISRQLGKSLTANRSGQWRYRIGDYRLICQIDDGRLVILALSVGHRREVYGN